MEFFTHIGTHGHIPGAPDKILDKHHEGQLTTGFKFHFAAEFGGFDRVYNVKTRQFKFSKWAKEKKVGGGYLAIHYFALVYENNRR
jgi:hypothetical protein